jgi:hypothetical protein
LKQADSFVLTNIIGLIVAEEHSLKKMYAARRIFEFSASGEPIRAGFESINVLEQEKGSAAL